MTKIVDGSCYTIRCTRLYYVIGDFYLLSYHMTAISCPLLHHMCFKSMLISVSRIAHHVCSAAGLYPHRTRHGVAHCLVVADDTIYRIANRSACSSAFTNRVRAEILPPSRACGSCTHENYYHGGHPCIACPFKPDWISAMVRKAFYE
jgi:hypothetical protein